ncbi:cysteine-rich receptor-like protein kinase 43 [Hevea brasiliensis]|uniref:cysteine-rich receptor-like protein kinase 43 n=1 Tax=Hevea brasiliensis TaxID=3981 RepID=UPI0025F50E93|nr:cysteine-rich receptor-like protein kinase 43 [Hevea brasiliensis]
MAPECLYGFPVTVQADVYNFGVVMLEIVSGEERMSMSNHKMQLLVHKAISFHEKKMTLELIDKKLKIPSDDQDQAKFILDLAIKCINQTPIMRPTMSFIVSELERTISKEKGFMHESGFEIDT